MKFAKKLVSLLLSVLLIASVFAVVPVSAGAEPVEAQTIAVFFTDSQDFGDVHIYAWDNDGDITKSWPGDAMTYLYTNTYGDGQDVYGFLLPATETTKIIFNGNGQQTGNIETGIEDGAWWYSDNNTAVALNNTFVAATDSTCTERGNVAYYNLIDELYDTDLNELADPRKPLAAHTWDTENPVWGAVEEDPEGGYRAGLTFSCSVCQETTTVYGKPQNTVHTDASCVSEGGDSAMFVIPFEEVDYSKELTWNVTPVDPAAHAEELTFHKAVAPKYNVPGNVAYYSCGACEKNFEDAEGTIEIADVTVPALKLASVDGVEYDTFEEAVEAANGEKIITLNGKVTEPYTLGVDETLIVNDYTKVTVVAPEGVYAVHREYTSSPKSYTFTVIDAVASLTVGETTTYYDTLNAAISAAPSITNADPDAFSTVTLLQDSVESAVTIGSVTARKAMTIDLGGKSVTLTRNYGTLFYIRNKSTVTVQNGTVNFDTVYANASGFVIDPGSTLNITSKVTANATGSTSVVFVTGNGAIVNTAGKLNSVDSFAIAGNGSSGKGGYEINVTGGTITTTNAPAIYHPNNGTLTITGGTINGATGVYVKSGTTTISGGTINGKGEKAAYVYDGNGANSTGDALVIDNCGYPGGAPTVTISKGTFVSTNADPIGIYTHGDNDPVTPVISGGTFSKAVDEYITDDVKIVSTSSIGRVSYMAEFPSALNDATYVLLDDVTRTSRLVPGTFASNIITIDLNGHTLTSTATDSAFLFSRGGSAASPKSYSIIDSSGNGAVIDAAADINISGKYNNFTLGEGVTFNGGGIAMVGEYENLIVNGTVNTTGNTFAISTNGSSTKNGTITINDGAVITSDFVGLFLPGGCTNNIYGASITAPTAIVIKSGTTNIDGAVVTATGEAAAYEFIGNGVKASTGDALLIDNCGYPAGAPVVNIFSGTFDSANGNPVVCYGTAGDPIGGFIAGGAYSDIVPEELIAAGYFCAVTKDVDGYYNIVSDDCPGHHFAPIGDVVACTICGKGYTGLVKVNGTIYYYEDGFVCKDKGLIEINNYYYYVLYDGRIKIDGDRTVTEEKANGLLPAGTYHFGADGKMEIKDGVIDEDDYYWEAGVIAKGKGLICIDGDYYYVTYTGKIKKDADRSVEPDKLNGYPIEPGVYHFDENGKMVLPENGVGEDGFYRVNGRIVKDVGIVEQGGYLYYVLYNGKVKMDGARTVTEEKANGLVPAGTYHFDEEGKMTDRPVAEPANGIGSDGFYRVNGEIAKDAGLIEIDGDYYYVTYTGKIKVDADRTVTEEKANGLVPAGTYNFGEDGKMTNPPVAEPEDGIGSDGLYRENGVVQYDKGVVKIGDDYYYVLYNGKVKKSAARTVTEEKANGLVLPFTYNFDADGKMIDPRFPVVEPDNGIGSDLYYRENGEIVGDLGIIQIDNDYYYVLPSGKVYVNGDRAVTAEKANGLVPAGNYHFGADGKMTNPPEFEIL